MVEQPHQTQFINERWTPKYKAVLTAQKDGLNWLFALNAGGVAGLLTYASAKQSSAMVILALISFSAGLLALIFFAVRYYYYEEKMFYDFKADVEKFRSGKLDWNILVENENARPMKYRACEIAAWISILSAIIGIVASSIAIL